MKQGTANLAEDYCFIHKALRPVSKARRKIAAVPPSNSRPGLSLILHCLYAICVVDPRCSSQHFTVVVEWSAVGASLVGMFPV